MADVFLYTAPADDTVAVESPIDESQPQSVWVNGVNVGGCEEKTARCLGDEVEDCWDGEVVLDSDDEERKQDNETASEETGFAKRQQGFAGCFRWLSNKISAQMSDSAGSIQFNGRSMAGRTALENARYQGLSEDAVDDRRLSSHISKARDKKLDAHPDFQCARLSYLDSPEPTESQGKALDFVNYYLSVSDFGISKDVEAGKAKRLKSPPSLISKGTQALARRVHLQGSASSKSSTFDWDELHIEKGEYSNQRKMNNLVVGLGGKKSVCLSVNEDSKVNQKISSLQSEGKSPGNTLHPNNLYMTSMHPDDIDRIESNYESCIVYDSMELDDQIDAGFLEQNVEKDEQVKAPSDTFDFGLDTQIAAEAMEALVHAPPPGADTHFADHVSDNLCLDSSNAINKKSKAENSAQHEEAIVSWRKKEKRSKCLTMSNREMSCPVTRKCNTRLENVSQLQVSKNLMIREVLSEKDLNSRSTGNRKNSKSEMSPTIIVQQEDDGFAERENRNKTSKFHSSSESSGCKMDDAKSKKVNSDASRKRRKLIHGDEREIGRKEEEMRGEMFNPQGANSNLLESNPWTYPKGKRTQLNVIRRLKRSSIHSLPCVEINENKPKTSLVPDEEAQKGAPKLLVYTRRQKSASKLLMYTRRRKFSSGRGLRGSSFKLSDKLGSPSVDNNEIFERQVQFPVQEEIRKLDHGHVSRSVDASDKKKLLVSSNGISRTPQVCVGIRKSELRNKTPSRTPLMKELSRLGYPESLPEFLPKDSRRRRATEKVCILFSQNLETDVLKKQKKIVARLGFSIASCCSDATHFVADRFVRTMNMLEAIALGKPVVTHLWLENCEQAGYVIDEKTYILRDEKKEKEIGFSMPVSLTRASQYPLLKGLRVFIAPNVKPGKDVIRSLVKAVQGQEIQNMEISKTEVIADDLLVLACEEDYDICLPFLEKGASIYSSELLLKGIVMQKLEYERYRLFKDFAKICSS